MNLVLYGPFQLRAGLYFGRAVAEVERVNFLQVAAALRMCWQVEHLRTCEAPLSRLQEWAAVALRALLRGAGLALGAPAPGRASSGLPTHAFRWLASGGPERAAQWQHTG